MLNYITSRSHLCCDLKYALKLCVEADKNREAVHLYTRLEQHERAVELALKVDNDLAADCASGDIYSYFICGNINSHCSIKVILQRMRTKKLRKS